MKKQIEFFSCIFIVDRVLSTVNTSQCNAEILKIRKKWTVWKRRG
jgi:hypothetical protein